MSEQNSNRNGINTLEIIRESLPYMSRKAKKPMELVLQAQELAQSVKDMEHTSSIESYELEEDSSDVEGLLVHIKELCPPQEQEQIDLALNFIKTQKLYQSYRSFMGNNSPSGKVNGFGFGNAGTTLMEFFTSQMTPEQKSTFDTLSMMMNTIQS